MTTRTRETLQLAASILKELSFNALVIHYRYDKSGRLQEEHVIQSISISEGDLRIWCRKTDPDIPESVRNSGQLF